ncbi:hypothetical protein GCM10010361_34850 [Streptomyces olivaceiscleroticus]|uniref:Uncharacterized protein n=1 Tax=Streptomyces olivaceiscleroticus TaxID=68245 RepID=A0ABN1A4Z8_9ACTN
MQVVGVRERAVDVEECGACHGCAFPSGTYAVPAYPSQRDHASAAPPTRTVRTGEAEYGKGGRPPGAAQPVGPVGSGRPV